MLCCSCADTLALVVVQCIGYCVLVCGVSVTLFVSLSSDDVIDNLTYVTAISHCRATSETNSNPLDSQPSVQRNIRCIF